MKKVLFFVAVCLAASSSYGQDKLVKKAQTKLDEAKLDKAQVDEAAAILAPALTSADTKDKATAENVRAKIEDRRHMIEGMKAQSKQPFDTLAFYNHLVNCVDGYVKAVEMAKANPKFKDLDKMVAANKQTIKTYRNNFAMAGIFFSANKNNLKAYEAFDRCLNVPKLSIFADSPNYFADDTSINPAQIAYCACMAGHEAKDDVKTLAHFDEAMKFDDKNSRSDLYILKLSILKKEGKMDEWERVSKEAVAAVPDQKMFPTNLVAYYISNKQDAKSMAFGDELIARNPNDKMGYRFKGVALFNQKKYQDAVTCFDKITQLDPTDSDAFLNAGACYGGMAMELYKTLPKNMNDPKYKAGEKKIKDFYQKAQPYYEKVRELKPDDKEAWGSHLQNIYYNLGDKVKEAEIKKVLGTK